MNKNSTTRHLQLLDLIPLLLTFLPLLVATILWMAGGIQTGTLSKTLAGAGITAIGGVATGIVADRFIRRKRSDIELLVGLALATLLGVLSIGYLYLIHLRGPMSSIGQLDRAVEQIAAFLTYLFAQAVGIQIARRSIPDLERTTKPAAGFEGIESNQG